MLLSSVQGRRVNSGEAAGLNAAGKGSTWADGCRAGALIHSADATRYPQLGQQLALMRVLPFPIARLHC